MDGSAWSIDSVEVAAPFCALAAARNRALRDQNTGVRALLVHALHEQAKGFYAHYGFAQSPHHPMTLMLRLNTVKA
jgi:hypothetical protein